MITKLKEPIFDYDPTIVALKGDALANQVCLVHDQPPILAPYIEWILNHYPVPLKLGSLEEVVLQMSEDVCIMRRDWLSWAFVCFPSGWRPEEKIGKSFSQLHEPVPGKIGKLPYSGNYERTVYGLGRGINRHPRFPIEHHFETRERQVMIGFGDSVLFIMRQYVGPITDLRLPTDPAMRRYKGLS